MLPERKSCQFSHSQIKLRKYGYPTVGNQPGAANWRNWRVIIRVLLDNLNSPGATAFATTNLMQPCLHCCEAALAAAFRASGGNSEGKLSPNPSPIKSALRGNFAWHVCVLPSMAAGTASPWQGNWFKHAAQAKCKYSLQKRTPFDKCPWCR